MEYGGYDVGSVEIKDPVDSAPPTPPLPIFAMKSYALQQSSTLIRYINTPAGALTNPKNLDLNKNLNFTKIAN